MLQIRGNYFAHLFSLIEWYARITHILCLPLTHIAISLLSNRYMYVSMVMNAYESDSEWKCRRWSMFLCIYVCVFNLIYYEHAQCRFFQFESLCLVRSCIYFYWKDNACKRGWEKLRDAAIERERVKEFRCFGGERQNHKFSCRSRQFFQWNSQ